MQCYHVLCALYGVWGCNVPRFVDFGERFICGLKGNQSMLIVALDLIKWVSNVCLPVRISMKFGLYVEVDE